MSRKKMKLSERERRIVKRIRKAQQDASYRNEDTWEAVVVTYAAGHTGLQDGSRVVEAVATHWCYGESMPEGEAEYLFRRATLDHAQQGIDHALDTVEAYGREHGIDGEPHILRRGEGRSIVLSFDEAAAKALVDRVEHK